MRYSYFLKAVLEESPQGLTTKGDLLELLRRVYYPMTPLEHLPSERDVEEALFELGLALERGVVPGYRLKRPFEVVVRGYRFMSQILDGGMDLGDLPQWILGPCEDTVASFVAQALLGKPESTLSLGELYRGYEEYCVIHARKSVSKARFKKSLMKPGSQLSASDGLFFDLAFEPEFSRWIALSDPDFGHELRGRKPLGESPE